MVSDDDGADLGRRRGPLGCLPAAGSCVSLLPLNERSSSENQTQRDAGGLPAARPAAISVEIHVTTLEDAPARGSYGTICPLGLGGQTAFPSRNRRASVSFLAPMDPTLTHSISSLLENVDDAERSSLTQIFPAIYEELRRTAERFMSRENAGHTLQPTALVHEALLRMRNQGVLVRGSTHAMALAAMAMRRILVDHARERSARKRGGPSRPFALSGCEESDHRDLEILELDDLIFRLAELDARRAQVVELRFFAGMSNEEIADTLGVARSTVAADWTVAKAWLRMQLDAGAAG